MMMMNVDDDECRRSVDTSVVDDDDECRWLAADVCVTDHNAFPEIYSLFSVFVFQCIVMLLLVVIVMMTMMMGNVDVQRQVDV